jgi:hypothetical protein
MVSQTIASSAFETITVQASRKYALPALADATLEMHGLDTALGGSVHISNHRFFRKPLLPFDEIVARLRSSLSEALEFYPPVAGTVRFNDKMEFVLTCDGEGATLIVERRDTPFTGDSDIVSPRPVPVLSTPAAVLAVKVTQVNRSLLHIICLSNRKTS